MPGPVLVAVDDDRECLSALERELGDRYSRDYRIICTASPEDALATLEKLAEDGEEVALVLAGQWLPGTTGSELFGKVRRLHPHAKRGLLITWGGWGDPATGEAIFDSMAHGRIDYYVLRPVGFTRRGLPPDHLELPARVGARPPRRSAHHPRGRRGLVRAGVRAEGGAGPLRDSALVLPRRLGRGARPARGCGKRARSCRS